MLKFLLILVLIFYLIYRVGGFFLKMLFSNAQQHQRQYQQNYNQQRPKNPNGGNVRVDFVPEDDKKDRKDFNGGQYVDFEEVK